MTQAFNLSQLANNLNTAGQLDATDGLVNAVPVTNGGTGASSVAAAVSNLSASIYPVGSVYINAAVNTNPGTLLGFGTWVQFAAGRVLMGVGGAFGPGTTGGSNDATLPTHNHTATSTVNDPLHRHGLQGNVGGSTQILGAQSSVVAGIGSGTGGFVDSGPGGFIMENKATGITVTTSNAAAGSSATNANLQPYIVVYMWLRTA